MAEKKLSFFDRMKKKKILKIIEKDKSQWVIIENNHPAIIPTEFFEKIQWLMKQPQIPQWEKKEK